MYGEIPELSTEALGQSYPLAITNALNSAKRTIVLWSPTSAKSSWVLAEAEKSRVDNKLLPLLLEDCELPLPHNIIHAHKITRLETDLEIILSSLGAVEAPGATTGHMRIARARTFTAKLPTTYAKRLYGRDSEMADLFRAWDGKLGQAKTNLIVFDAIGGAGKTALITHFIDNMKTSGWCGADYVYCWSFYSQGTDEKRQGSADEFFSDALAWFGYSGEPMKSQWEKGRMLAALVNRQRTLLLLDGMEPLQYPDHQKGVGGRLRDQGLEILVKELARENLGLCIITTRLAIPELESFQSPVVITKRLDKLPIEQAADLLFDLGVTQSTLAERKALAEDYEGHALALTLVGRYLAKVHQGDIRQNNKLPVLANMPLGMKDRHPKRIMRRYEIMFENVTRESANRGLLGILFGVRRPSTEITTASRQLSLLYLMGLFDRRVEAAAIDTLLEAPAIRGLTDNLVNLRPGDWNFVVDALRDLGLISPADAHSPSDLDCHPLVREYFGPRLRELNPSGWRQAHERLYDHYKSRGLPNVFSAAEMYGLLVLKTCFPEDFQRLLVGHIDGGLSKCDYQKLPSSVLCAKKSSLRNAAKIVHTQAFTEALRHFQPVSEAQIDPLFAAIAHGCAAGQHERVWNEVCATRVFVGDEGYSGVKLSVFGELGLFGEGLSAISHYFEQLFSKPVSNIPQGIQLKVLQIAATALRALGRLTDAASSMRTVAQLAVDNEEWARAASAAGNLSELLSIIGETLDGVDPIAMAAESVSYADKSGNTFLRIAMLTALIDALHWAGDLAQIDLLASKAERLQALDQPHMPQLYSVAGYQYFDVLLSRGQFTDVIARAEQSLRWSEARYPLISTGLSRLAIGRAYAELGNIGVAQNHLNLAVNALQTAGMQEFTIRGHLARAAFRRVAGDMVGSHNDLADAFDIAERGNMRLFLIDCWIEAARQLLVTPTAANIRETETALDHATTLIAKTGLKRRMPELHLTRAAFHIAQGDECAARLALRAAVNVVILGWWCHIPELERLANRDGAASLEPLLDNLEAVRGSLDKEGMPAATSSSLAQQRTSLNLNWCDKVFGLE